MDLGFFTEGNIIMDYGFVFVLSRRDGLKLKCLHLLLTNMQLFTSQDVN